MNFRAANVSPVQSRRESASVRDAGSLSPSQPKTVRGNGPSIPATGAEANDVSVRINIGRLVMAGISSRQRAVVMASLERRLTELVIRVPRRKWELLADIERVDGGTLRPSATPEQIGKHLAEQIVRGLDRTKRV